MSNSYHHGDLKNALLREATRVLEESGPDSLSLRALARCLEVSHAAPRHHFSDRRGLLAEIAADGFEVLADRLERALDRKQGSDEVDLVYESGLAYGDVALESPQRFKLMFGGGFLGADDCPERLRSESSRAFAALLRISRGAQLGEEELEAIDPANFRIQVPEFATWALVHGAATLQVDNALALEPEEFRELFGQLLKQLSVDRSSLWSAS